MDQSRGLDPSLIRRITRPDADPGGHCVDRTERRAAALQAAASLPYISSSVRNLTRIVLDVAAVFDTWLSQHNPVADFAITADQPRPRGETVSLTFPDTQEVTLHVTAVTDAEGAAVTDTFTWAVDTATVLTLTPSADTLSCVAVPGTTAGAATVTATASDGVARTFAIDVTTGPVASFEITADTPTDRPATAPAAPAETPAAGA